MFQAYNMASIVSVFTLLWFLEKKPNFDLRKNRSEFIKTNLVLTVLALLGYAIFNRLRLQQAETAHPFQISWAHLLITILVVDLLSYLVHLSMHKIPLFW